MRDLRSQPWEGPDASPEAGRSGTIDSKDFDSADAVTRRVDHAQTDSILMDDEVTVSPIGLTIDVATLKPLAVLEVVNGREALSTHKLYDGVINRIGTGPNVEVRIQSSNVSGHHASIAASLTDRRVSIWLEDHGSLTGTVVNGARITGCEIHPDDVIRIGDTDLTCRVLRDASD